MSVSFVTAMLPLILDRIASTSRSMGRSSVPLKLDAAQLFIGNMTEQITGS